VNADDRVRLGVEVLGAVEDVGGDIARADRVGGVFDGALGEVREQLAQGGAAVEGLAPEDALDLSGELVLAVSGRRAHETPRVPVDQGKSCASRIGFAGPGVNAQGWASDW